MNEHNPDVLIYINKIKSFINNDKETFDFFLSNTNNEKFFNELIIVSEKNMTETGNPEVSKEQFIKIRVNTWIKPIYLDSSGASVFSLN